MNNRLTVDDAQTLFDSNFIKNTINQKADFEQMAELEYYKEHQDLLRARAKDAGIGEDDIKKLISIWGGASPTSPSVQPSSSIFPSLESSYPTTELPTPTISIEDLNARLANLK
ncbi:MAG: hypothetical protein L6V95_03330 [Candidatus Melainabacteria bacterium]|nr:MAG: hypothetical protein L6V95_03330 [Candidatus Melainabacteria bacterium]